MTAKELSKDAPLSAGISVVICSHNGAQRIAKTIKHIWQQKTDPDLQWELIFVDNASTDNTAQIVADTWKSLGADDRISIVSEPKKGLAYAIDKALNRAIYSYSLICDDDNLLAPNYLQLAFTIMEANPYIGMLGGRGIPSFDMPPPAWFNLFEAYYAVGPQSNESGRIAFDWWQVKFIWGAGAIINMKSYKKLIAAGFTRIITTHNNPRCEDIELSLAIQMSGYDIWYDENLVYTHCIPNDRLSWDYLLKLTKSGADGRPYFFPYNQSIKPGINHQEYYLFWRHHVKRWRKLILLKLCNPRFIYSLLCILFGKNRNGDVNFQKDFSDWYEFIAINNFKQKYKELFSRVYSLKHRIYFN